MYTEDNDKDIVLKSQHLVMMIMMTAKTTSRPIYLFSIQCVSNQQWQKAVVDN